MTQVKSFFKEQKSLGVLIVIIVAMSIASPFFLSGANLLNVLNQATIYGIMACGMTFAIINGEFDLSVGSILAFSGLVAVILEPMVGQVGSILLALASGMAFGLLNGFLIAKVKISSFIVTIGTMGIIKGLALKISGGNPISSSNPWYSEIGNGTLGGLPYSVIIFIILIAISWYVLSATRFGRNVYIIGGNAEVAHNSGINVLFHKTMVFVISGLCAAIAGIVLSSRLNTASAIQGDAASLAVISSVVIGGTSLVGGVGSIFKSIVGIFIFTIITNALDILGVFSYYQLMIRGILLVVIIGIDAYANTRK